jgi:hypothetical protein
MNAAEVRIFHPQRGAGGISRLDSRRLCDLARADAAGTYPDVLRPSVDHRTHPLEVGQPAPFRHVVGVGDVAAAHRPLAADFTSLRHIRTPSRDPRRGVKLNSTGVADYQVLPPVYGAVFLPYRDRNTCGDGKRTGKIFTEKKNGSNKITMVATKNDTLIRVHGPDQ